MAFSAAALLALVAVSGSQDRAPVRVSSDTAVLQATDMDRQIN